MSMLTVFDFPQYDSMTQGEKNAFGKVLHQHQMAAEEGSTFQGTSIDRRTMVAFKSLESKGILRIVDNERAFIVDSILMDAAVEEDTKGMPDFSDADEYKADDPAMIRPSEEVEDPLDREYGIYAPKADDEAVAMIDAIEEFFGGPVMIDDKSTSEIRAERTKVARTLAPYAMPKMATRRVIDTETTYTGVFAVIEEGDEDYAFGHTLIGFINDSSYEFQVELTGERTLFYSGEAKIFQLADDVEAITSSGRTNVKATIWRTLTSFTQLTVSELTEAVNVIATHHTGKALDEKYVHAYLKELSEAGLATCRSDKGTKVQHQVWAAIEKAE